MFGSASAPSGWQLCNGGSALTSALQAVVGSNVPDLRDKFVVGSGSSYSYGNTGGSKDATLVSHSHTINNHTHSTTISGTTSNKSLTGSIEKIGECFDVAGSATGVFSKDSDGSSPVTASASTSPVSGVNFDASHDHTFSGSGTSGNPSDRGTDTQGSSATNANLPPYYAIAYIMRIS